MANSILKFKKKQISIIFKHLNKGYSQMATSENSDNSKISH